MEDSCNCDEIFMSNFWNDSTVNEICDFCKFDRMPTVNIRHTQSRTSKLDYTTMEFDSDSKVVMKEKNKQYSVDIHGLFEQAESEEEDFDLNDYIIPQVVLDKCYNNNGDDMSAFIDDSEQEKIEGHDAETVNNDETESEGDDDSDETKQNTSDDDDEDNDDDIDDDDGAWITDSDGEDASTDCKNSADLEQSFYTSDISHHKQKHHTTVSSMDCFDDDEQVVPEEHLPQSSHCHQSNYTNKMSKLARRQNSFRHSKPRRTTLSYSQVFVAFGKLTVAKTYKFPQIMPTEIIEIVQFWEMDYQVGDYIVPRMSSWAANGLEPNAEENIDDYNKYCAYKILYKKWVKSNKSIEQWYLKYGYLPLEKILNSRLKGKKRKYISEFEKTGFYFNDTRHSPKEKRKCLNLETQL